MKSFQDHNPIPPDSTERMQFLLSRKRDGDLTAEDLSELEAFQTPESLNTYLAKIAQIGEELKSLPVNPVSEVFALSIHQAILNESAQLPMPKSWRTRLGGARRGIIAVTIAVCVMGLIFIVRRNVVDHSMQVAEKSILGSASTETPGLAGDTFEHQHSEASSAIVAKSPEQDVEAQQAELRPFLESDDWQIVVVRVNSKDREEVMRDIEAIVAKNDMGIETVIGNYDERDARFGVLLTSASVDEKQFIDSVIPQGDVNSTDWDAQNVAESTRASFINRLQESLKTPTHSELNFGQVYLTLPKHAASGADPLLATNNAPALTSRFAEVPSGASVKVQNAAVPETRKPVLVVFEFADSASDHI